MNFMKEFKVRKYLNSFLKPDIHLLKDMVECYNRYYHCIKGGSMFVFKPSILTSFKGYKKEQLLKDIEAGIIVSIVALPLSIALAVASGLNPAQGIYTAIFLGLVLALTSGSPVQVGGPTGTFLILTLGVMTKFGFTGVFIVTVLSSLILILMGLLGLGKIIKYIPYPVLSGFKVGIALVILTTQIPDFLGFDASKIPDSFLSKWGYFLTHLNNIHLQSFFLGLLTLMIIILSRKFKSKIPGSFIALILVTLLAALLHLDLPTLGSAYSLKAGFVKPFTGVVWSQMVFNREIFSFAFSLAILCAMEGLLSAVVADGMMNTKHDSNTELISEGLANIVSVTLGGLPGVGAIARTATNVQNGGRTPVSALTHCIILTIIVLFFTPLLNFIPLATLAGILFIVSYDMSDWKSFVALFRAPKSDILVLLTTLILTVIIDLAFAIQVSMVLASILFMKRMSEVTNFKQLEYDEDDLDGQQFLETLPSYSNKILIYNLNGPFFFGAADRFMEVMETMGDHHQVIIIRMRHVPAMDATALHALKNMVKKCRKLHKTLILSGVQEQPLKVLTKAGFIDLIGENQLKPTIYDAIEYGNQLVNFK
jgi:sulfate permease, SulP family